MPNYLFFLREDPSVFEHVSPGEMQAIILKYSEWKRRLQSEGVLVGGEKLQDGTGRVLRKSGGQASITDGPYTESKEVIGGLFEIRAADYDAAVGIADDCPHLEYGAIEIREIEPVGAAVAGEGGAK
jgi:hypothetical protein